MRVLPERDRHSRMDLPEARMPQAWPKCLAASTGWTLIVFGHPTFAWVGCGILVSRTQVKSQRVASVWGNPEGPTRPAWHRTRDNLLAGNKIALQARPNCQPLGLKKRGQTGVE
jgi:hypothetical protein